MANGKWKMFRPLSPPDACHPPRRRIHIFHFPFTIFHLSLLLLLLPSCAKVAVEGGDKPIHIVMDVNIRVDRELEQFFAFEEQYRATPATTQPATQPAAVSTTATTGSLDDQAKERN